MNMAKALGKDQAIIVDTVPPTAPVTITQFVNDVTHTGTGKTQDITMAGEDDEVHGGTVRGGSMRMGGRYDTAATGTPQKLFKNHETETFEITNHPEGTGTGKPAEVAEYILEQYEESRPAAGHIMWTSQWRRTGPLVISDQA